MSKARNLSKLGVDTSGLVDASTAIADSSITSAKIADSSITSAKMADSSVTTSKVASGVAQANLGLTTWTVTEVGGVLYFKVNGVNKAKLDTTGNLTVIGNSTAYGTA